MSIAPTTPNGQIVQAVRTGWDAGNKTADLGATATSFTPSSKVIALSSSVAYHINVGGTADSNDLLIPANTLWYNYTDGAAVSVIMATATGTLTYSEIV